MSGPDHHGMVYHEDRIEYLADNLNPHIQHRTCDYRPVVGKNSSQPRSGKLHYHYRSQTHHNSHLHCRIHDFFGPVVESGAKVLGDYGNSSRRHGAD